MSSPEGLAEIADEGDYTQHQSFTADETAFDWKRIPSRTFIAREKSVPGFRVSMGFQKWVTWSWSQCLWTKSNILRPSRIMQSQLDLYGVEKEVIYLNGWEHTCEQHKWLHILRPSLRWYCSETKNFFQNIIVYLGVQELWWRCIRNKYCF